MLKVWKRKFSSIYTIHVLCRSQKYNFYILYSQCWMLDVSMDVSVIKRRKCGVVVLYFCWKGDLSDSCTRLPLRPRLWLRPPGPWRMWEKLQTNYIEPGCGCCWPPILGRTIGGVIPYQPYLQSAAAAGAAEFIYMWAGYGYKMCLVYTLMIIASPSAECGSYYLHALKVH